MTVGATRKVSSYSSTSSKVGKFRLPTDNHSQFVENIDTNNNVLVRDDGTDDNHSSGNQQKQQEKPKEFSAMGNNISVGAGVLTMNIIDESDETPQNRNLKVDVYINNQAIIKDEEVEKIGRSYLKQFYEKNEHPADVDELI